MRSRAITLSLSLAALAVAAPGNAQLHITPTAGAYHPGQGAFDVGNDGRLMRGRALGLGLNIEAGFLRGTIVYASGATIDEQGIGTGGDIGDGTLLAMTAGIAFRPLPRLFGFQPYALLGGGIKRFDYANDRQFADLFPSHENEFVLQYGAGADLMLGGLGLIAEVYDLVTPELGDGRRHDTFVQLGFRFRVGRR